ncbi:cytochrome c' precursor [Variibacter gotjawalensis]|uniref:Cytochrome c n=1 Tax=Variibacter gotjawalensis TaxID=1333996 RepID=A0A0S3PUN2_9BRAD|nr:cytochrome c [Variibacter gotjawalensis]NIK49996.1 cytochrome c556 [Variibacter gotjawalensis]RZS45995.1 cytochrome c556 [Variibacter gotjawalensis]BAT59670.1 cytochrome c' precursor [Variibacter gotjawalensis]
MLRTVLTAALVTLGATVVVAQDPIAARKELMKGVGAQARNGAQMVRGEQPFELAKAQTVFKVFQDAGEKFPAMFPENSKTGGDTAALPAIWTNMPDFKAKSDKLAADAKAAQASVKDLETFKTAFGGIGRDCGACHETYRAKRN